MDKLDALFLFGAILALCGAIMAAPLQLIEGNNPGLVLLLIGIIIMLVGTVMKFTYKP
jgi:hypothetical protein